MNNNEYVIIINTSKQNAEKFVDLYKNENVEIQLETIHPDLDASILTIISSIPTYLPNWEEEDRRLFRIAITSGIHFDNIEEMRGNVGGGILYNDMDDTVDDDDGIRPDRLVILLSTLEEDEQLIRDKYKDALEIFCCSSNEDGFVNMRIVMECKDDQEEEFILMALQTHDPSKGERYVTIDGLVTLRNGIKINYLENDEDE